MSGWVNVPAGYCPYPAQINLLVFKAPSKNVGEILIFFFYFHINQS